MKQMIVAIMLMTMLASVAVADQELHENVLGAYAFSYGNWNDRSPHAAHFTDYGTPTAGTGYIGDGAPSTVATRTTTSWLFEDNSWSTCFMVQPADENDHSATPWYREGNPTSTHFKMYQNGADAVYAYDDSFNLDSCTLTATGALSIGQWTHLCYVKGATAKIYVDGVEAASGCPNQLNTVNGNSTINVDMPLDEMVFYNSTLTNTDVTHAYDAVAVDMNRYPFVNCKVNYNTFIQETGWTMTRNEFRDFRRTCLLSNRQERNG